MTDNYTEEVFNCWVPASVIVKSGNGKAPAKRMIQGIASTNSTDLQGEVVDPVGIDFDYFLKYGYFNDDHKQGNEFRVGQPVDCKVTKNGLWVKGFLFNNNERADAIWNLMNSLESSGSSRKMGFSIEGKVRRRNGQKIEKCWIQNVAVTAQPVNTNTWAEIVKSLAAKNEGQEDADKALQATDSPLVPEGLDKEIKDTKDNVSKSYSFDETVRVLQDQYGMPEDGAVAVAKVVFAVV